MSLIYTNESGDVLAIKEIVDFVPRQLDNVELRINGSQKFYTVKFVQFIENHHIFDHHIPHVIGKDILIALMES